MSISAVILTFNSEAVLDATLDSVAKISDDIHVVDPFSNDRTLDTAFMPFVYKYVLRLGFLDGGEGLIYFLLQTLWFRALIDAMLFETQKLEHYKG